MGFLLTGLRRKCMRLCEAHGQNDGDANVLQRNHSHNVLA